MRRIDELHLETGQMRGGLSTRLRQRYQARASIGQDLAFYIGRMPRRNRGRRAQGPASDHTT